MLEVVFCAGSPIPQYIRDLYIIDGQGREFDPKWVNEKLPLATLSSITCISSLSLEQVDFSGLSGATLAALGGITARVTRVELTYVRFKDLAGCSAFLSAAATLRSLTSCVTSFEDEARSPRPVIATILPELVELELEGNDDPLLDLVCSTSSPPCIRAFSLYLGSNNISAVASFLRRLGSSLTHLHIQSFSSDRTPSDMNAHETDLSKNPNLKNIIFGPNSSPWIVKILATAAPTLERVYMQLPSDYFDFPSLRRIFMMEGSALRRTEIVLWNIDLGTRATTMGWLEDATILQYPIPGTPQAMVLSTATTHDLPLSHIPVLLACPAPTPSFPSWSWSFPDISQGRTAPRVHPSSTVELCEVQLTALASWGYRTCRFTAALGIGALPRHAADFHRTCCLNAIAAGCGCASQDTEGYHWFSTYGGVPPHTDLPLRPVFQVPQA
ncbi:hypothetical protein K438DRAFT_1986788 [Mycena galopus ATCC 62051]|nr:hypothetical protein K438DRAFT_1986788 [Mycena galopus ATCC 62051]